MGDWVVRAVAAFCLIGTGIIVGALIVSRGFGDQHGFPSTESERLQWEVLISGLFAIAAGVLAYRGATAPHRLQQRQWFHSYSAKVHTALEPFIMSASPPRGLFRGLGSTPEFQQMRRPNIAQAAQFASENFPTPPDQITTIPLLAKVEQLKLSLSFLAFQEAWSNEVVLSVLEEAEALQALLRQKAGGD